MSDPARPLTEQDVARMALSTARQATNGWACHARTKREHSEIARLHGEINDLDAALLAHRAQLELWLVFEYEHKGLRGVFASQEAAEAEIRAICHDHPDLTRRDFVVQVERLRDAVLASGEGQ